MLLNNDVKYTTMPIVRINKNVQLTDAIAVELVNKWGSQRNRYQNLQDYYAGYHDILERYFDDATKPNNQLVNNFASYIVDVRTGYFTGTPITYMSKNQDYLAKLNEVFDLNNEPEVTSELDKMSNIKGHAFELFWIDEDANVRFKELKPDELIMIYSSDIDMKPLYAIRYYDEKDIITEMSTLRRIFIYSDTTVRELEVPIGVNNQHTLISVKNHYFGQVPVLEYMNNTERTGSFEDVVSLIDAYNIAQSDSVNEIQYFNDAYLKIVNMSQTETEDIAKMKENRVILVEGDGDAQFLTKDVNDAYLENIKERISKDIHKFSKTPNLVSDDFISNLSGTAIRYKVWGLEQDSAKKERRWKQIIMQRIAMITKILNTLGGNYNPSEITMSFNRNLPQNVMELGQMVSQLRGTVSVETLLAQLPFIDNVEIEKQKLKQDIADGLDPNNKPDTSNPDKSSTTDPNSKTE